MNRLPNLFRSLLLTSIFAFLVPVLLLGGIAVLLVGVEHLPGLRGLGQVAIAQFIHFLQVFGSSNPVQGAIVLGIVCSLVGLLFDTYTFYRRQHWGVRDER